MSCNCCNDHGPSSRMKENLQDYTKQEFYDFIADIIEVNTDDMCEHCEWLAHFELITGHPQADKLLNPENGENGSPERVIASLEAWLLANGRPTFKASEFNPAVHSAPLPRAITDFTEAEYLKLVIDICEDNSECEREHNKWVEEFIKSSEHPHGSDLIYWPSPEEDNSPEGILNTIKTWRAANGKPGFRQP